MDNKTIIEFLDQLGNNNRREWFNDNRQSYQIALGSYKKLIAELISKIAIFDSGIKYLSPENTIFRIYRDIRFSHDKTPYKTHFGAYIAPFGGRKSRFAGYYLHLDAKQSFLGGGLYCPDNATLKKIRTALDENFDEFNQIISQKSFKTNFGTVESFGEELKKTPVGFDKNSAAAAFLKHKHFVLEHRLDLQTLYADNFVDYAAKIFESAKKFNDFFNQIIED